MGLKVLSHSISCIYVHLRHGVLSNSFLYLNSICYLTFRSTSAYITVAAFLLGALCSGIAGYIGMWVSVRANVRVSSAARRSAREALQVP
ncbi:hypothetical protein BHE74_00013117 [Ensete ventricosum]|nr:hypothetical protein BHE74_00013117 [Ensete ventricosum]